MMRDIMAEGDQLAEFRSPSRWFASMRDPPSALGKRALTGGGRASPVRGESWFRSATNPLDAIAPSIRTRRSGPDTAGLFYRTDKIVSYVRYW